MRQLHFKFDPLPTKSAEICLFHERWIKAFDTQPFGPLCIKYDLVLENWFGPILQQLFGSSFTKKPSFGHSENEKWFLRPKKMKTSLGNIVWNSKMHHCAQYEIIWTDYAMNVAIRLIIWLESHWSPHVIARFWEHFFQIIAVLQVCYFSWELGHI